MEIIINKTYELIGDIRPLCCENIIKRGTKVTVIHQTSKNRLMVNVHEKGWGGHKIKKSTLNRLGVLINNEKGKTNNRI